MELSLETVDTLETQLRERLEQEQLIALPLAGFTYLIPISLRGSRMITRWQRCCPTSSGTARQGLLVTKTLRRGTRTSLHINRSKICT